MSRKPLITIIVYVPHSRFCPQLWCTSPFSLSCEYRTLTGGWSVLCYSVFAPGHSTFWFSSWANDSVSVCACVCVCSWLSRLVSSSSVPLMVHSEVVQWWAVKYSAVFSVYDSLRYPRTRKQQMNQGHIVWGKKNKGENLIFFMCLNSFSTLIIIILFPFVLLLD